MPGGVIPPTAVSAGISMQDFRSAFRRAAILGVPLQGYTLLRLSDEDRAAVAVAAHDRTQAARSKAGLPAVPLIVRTR